MMEGERGTSVTDMRRDDAPQSGDARTLVRDEERSYLEMMSSRGIDLRRVTPHEDGTIRPQKRRTAARTVLIPAAENLSGGQEVAIGETIGAGGMGVVKMAEQLRLRRKVAVKVVNRDSEAALALGSDQIVREALVTGALEHPNIVPVHTLTQDEEGMPALVMKHVEGVPWSRLLRDPRAHTHVGSARTALEFHIGVLQEVCNAVHFAHSRGIVHRDLKPANVMVGPFGEVYLLDWGIAVSIRDESAHLAPSARDITLAGTPSYMAPEMAACEGDRIDERTDVYMLGAILHEIVTGERRHQTPNYESALVAAFLSRPYAYDEAVPRELALICNQATNREPSLRHATAEAFRQALAAFEHHEASRQLSSAASERLDTLQRSVTEHARLSLAGGDEASGPAAEIHKLAAEARFGFQQALETWPENEEAARGYEQVLLATIDFHLHERSRDAASALLAELENPPESLKARFDALDAAIRKRRARIASLQQLARGMDMQVDAAQRARNVFILAGAVAVVIGVPTALNILGMYHPGYPTAIGCSLVFAVAGALVGRGRNRDHEIASKLRLCLVTAVAWFGLVLTFGMAAGIPYHVGLAIGMLTVALAMLIVALSIAPAIVAAVPSLVLGGFGALLTPSRPGVAVLLGTVTALLVVGVISRRQGTNRRLEAPLSRL